ncbi:DUF397 domain-containing protein [Streptomyces sp. NPDC050732]|uniref:DUF397 domain-containing protein n=1 Tax=Streptomyces sp. NPDC050732 TaxID=3154632 RepID=UPI003422E242
MGGSWTWRKSSASDGSSGTCVEIAWTGDAVLVRDSVCPRGSVLAFRPQAWTAFVGRLAGTPPDTRRGPRDDERTARL